jgi:copper chaperone
MQVFSVEGMTCGHCVRAVTDAVRNQDPAASVNVNLAAKESVWKVACQPSKSSS